MSPATPPSAMPMAAWTQAAPAAQPPSGRTRPSRLRPRFATWLVACLTLSCLWFFLPLKALGANDQESFDEAILETAAPRSIPHFPLGVTFGTGDAPDASPESPHLCVEPAPSGGRPHGPASALGEILCVSRFCARSRLSDEAPPSVTRPALQPASQIVGLWGNSSVDRRSSSVPHPVPHLAPPTPCYGVNCPDKSITPATSPCSPLSLVYRALSSHAPTRVVSVCDLLRIWWLRASSLAESGPSPTSASIEEKIRAAVEAALLSQPPRGYRRIPPGVRLLGVSAEGNRVSLNFSKELLANHDQSALEDALHQILSAAREAAIEIRDIEFVILVEGSPLK